MNTAAAAAAAAAACESERHSMLAHDRSWAEGGVASGFWTAEWFLRKCFFDLLNLAQL
jgi:hypothetical protein